MPPKKGSAAPGQGVSVHRTRSSRAATATAATERGESKKRGRSASNEPASKRSKQPDGAPTKEVAEEELPVAPAAKATKARLSSLAKPRAARIAPPAAPPSAPPARPSLSKMASGAGAGGKAPTRAASAERRSAPAPPPLVASALARTSSSSYLTAGAGGRRASISSSSGPAFAHIASSGYGRPSLGGAAGPAPVRRASCAVGGASSLAHAAAAASAAGALEGRSPSSAMPAAPPPPPARATLARSALGTSRIGGAGAGTTSQHLQAFDKNLLAVLMAGIGEAKGLADKGRIGEAEAVLGALVVDLPAARTKAVYWATRASLAEGDAAGGQGGAYQQALGLLLSGIEACAGAALEVTALSAGVRRLTALMAGGGALAPRSAKRGSEAKGGAAAAAEQRAEEDDALVAAVFGAEVPFSAVLSSEGSESLAALLAAPLPRSPSFATAEEAGLPTPAAARKSVRKSTGKRGREEAPSLSDRVGLTPAVAARLAALSPALALVMSLGLSAARGSAAKPRVSFGRSSAVSFRKSAPPSRVATGSQEEVPLSGEGGEAGASPAAVLQASVSSSARTPGSSGVPESVRDAYRTLDTIRSKVAARRTGDSGGSTPSALSSALRGWRAEGAGEEEDGISPPRVLLKSTRKAARGTTPEGAAPLPAHAAPATTGRLFSALTRLPSMLTARGAATVGRPARPRAQPIQMGSVLVPDGGMRAPTEAAATLRSAAKALVEGRAPSPVPAAAAGTPAAASVRRSVRAHRSAVQAALMSPAAPGCATPRAALVLSVAHLAALTSAVPSARNPLLRSALRSARDLAAARLYSNAAGGEGEQEGGAWAGRADAPPRPSALKSVGKALFGSAGGRGRQRSSVGRLSLSGSTLFMRGLSEHLSASRNGMDVSAAALAEVAAGATEVEVEEGEEGEGEGRPSLGGASVASAASVVLDRATGLPLVRRATGSGSTPATGGLPMPVLGRADLSLLDSLGEALGGGGSAATATVAEVAALMAGQVIGL